MKYKLVLNFGVKKERIRFGGGANLTPLRNFTQMDVKSSIEITTQLIFILSLLKQSEH